MFYFFLSRRLQKFKERFVALVVPGQLNIHGFPGRLVKFCKNGLERDTPDHIEVSEIIGKTGYMRNLKGFWEKMSRKTSLYTSYTF
ncbi:MAG TPA: hypothetical protein GXZ25_05590 [Peptococcaceae bacterium]|nr:hypothetical protein [Peptococcaceae bacterium]